MIVAPPLADGGLLRTGRAVEVLINN
jgi:hypothetical protein